MLFLVMFMKAYDLIEEYSDRTVKKENQPVIESIRCKKI